MLFRSNLPDYRVDETTKALGFNLDLQTKGDLLNKQKAFKTLTDGKRYFTKFLSMRAKALIKKMFFLPKLTQLKRHMKIDNEVLKECKKITKNVLWGPCHKALIAEVFWTKNPQQGGIGWPDLMTSILANKLLGLLNIVTRKDEYSKSSFSACGMKTLISRTAPKLTWIKRRIASMFWKITS